MEVRGSSPSVPGSRHARSTGHRPRLSCPNLRFVTFSGVPRSFCSPKPRRTGCAPMKTYLIHLGSLVFTALHRGRICPRQCRRLVRQDMARRRANQATASDPVRPPRRALRARAWPHRRGGRRSVAMDAGQIGRRRAGRILANAARLDGISIRPSRRCAAPSLVICSLRHQHNYVMAALEAAIQGHNRDVSSRRPTGSSRENSRSA